MEYFKPLQLIINWVIKILGFKVAQEKEKVQRVIDYIDTCMEHMHTIMGYANYSENVVEQSRKFLQGAHQDIAIHLDKVATTKECDIIKKSLMSARVYFHAIKDGEVRDEQIKNDYQERYFAYTNNTYSQDEYRQNSYEKFLKYLVNDGEHIDPKDMNYELQRIREVCQEDVARIQFLKERLKTRKVIV